MTWTRLFCSWSKGSVLLDMILIRIIGPMSRQWILVVLVSVSLSTEVFCMLLAAVTARLRSIQVHHYRCPSCCCTTYLHVIMHRFWLESWEQHLLQFPRPFTAATLSHGFMNCRFLLELLLNLHWIFLVVVEPLWVVVFTLPHHRDSFWISNRDSKCLSTRYRLLMSKYDVVDWHHQQ